MAGGLLRTVAAAQALLLLTLLPLPALTLMLGKNLCQGSGGLKNLVGNALTDNAGCIGPDGRAYPHTEVAEMVAVDARVAKDAVQGRQGRSLQGTMAPKETSDLLMRTHKLTREGGHLSREKREDNCVVGGAPPRLCKSTYNTTAPMYGVSLTSGQPVTIVQKFPDLLQQVIYETCDSSECEVLHGECIQTYVPYLFLVIPLGPVTLTGQDYVLVESGCTCRPKYATPGTDPNPQDIIPNFS